MIKNSTKIIELNNYTYASREEKKLYEFTK